MRLHRRRSLEQIKQYMKLLAPMLHITIQITLRCLSVSTSVTNNSRFIRYLMINSGVSVCSTDNHLAR